MFFEKGAYGLDGAKRPPKVHAGCGALKPTEITANTNYALAA